MPVCLSSNGQARPTAPGPQHLCNDPMVRNTAVRKSISPSPRVQSIKQPFGTIKPLAPENQRLLCEIHQDLPVASIDLVKNTSSATSILQSLEENSEDRVDGLEVYDSELESVTQGELAERIQEMKIDTPPEASGDVFVRKSNNSVHNPTARRLSKSSGNLTGAKKVMENYLQHHQ